MDNDKGTIKDYLTVEGKAKRYADLPKHHNHKINRRIRYDSYKDGYIDGAKDSNNEIGELREVASEGLVLFSMINDLDDLMFYHLEIEEFKTKVMKIFRNESKTIKKD